MEAQQVRRSTSAVTSRRQLRRRKPRLRDVLTRSVPKTVLVGTLGAATIAVPLVNAGAGEGGALTRGVVVAGGPAAHEVLSETAPPALPSVHLLAPQVSRASSELASRSLERDALPGCDPDVVTDSPNGQIPADDLCTLWDGVHMLRGDAAVTLTELNENFAVEFGRDLCLTDSYRTLASQRRLAATKPGLAATPGRSNHGWGLAIDLCGSETNSSAVMAWLRTNGPVYGWINPPWAQRGGSGPYEPWHWEYVPGTSSMGTDWGS